MSSSRHPLTLWVRSSYIAVICLIGAQWIIERNPWQLILRIVGLIALVVAIALMFAGRRANGTT